MLLQLLPYQVALKKYRIYVGNMDSPTACGLRETDLPWGEFISVTRSGNTYFYNQFGIPNYFFVSEEELNLASDSKYWNNISIIAGEQRKKGIKNYHQTLEQNNCDIQTRLRYLEEELIDGLMYIEWIKAYIAESKMKSMSKEGTKS